MIKTLKNIFLVFLCLISIIACGTSKEEKVKAKMEQELLEDFGEEFVVENIGLREANGIKFYQASIYPKSIIGTPKEEDSYYYSTASVDVSRLNKPRSVGSSYGVIKMNDEAEEYLILKAKELFGDKIRLKANIEYLEKEGDYYVTFLENGFKEKKELTIKEPEKYRMYVNLYIYIFDKIDNDKEKEARRKQLFEFIKYLKNEGLFEYCNLNLIFLDDYVITDVFKRKGIDINDSTEYIVNNNTVYLPEKNEINLIYEECKIEYNQMTKEDILNRIGLILKSELSYKYFAKYGAQMYIEIYSKQLAINEYKSAVEIGEIVLSDYKDIKDIVVKLELNYLFNKNLKEVDK